MDILAKTLQAYLGQLGWRTLKAWGHRWNYQIS